MSIDLFTRLRAFNDLYYSTQIGRKFVLPPESREVIFKDDELWDHHGMLDEKLALERYGISIEEAPPEELKKLIIRYAQELREAKHLLDQFETDEEGVRGVFKRFSGGETLVALDEKIAEMEEDLLNAPEHIKLKAKNKELRRQLTELKQSAGSSPNDRALRKKITELENKLGQIEPELDKYRAHPAIHTKPADFIKILANIDEAKKAIKENDEAKQKLVAAEKAVDGEKSARQAAETEAAKLRDNLTEREKQYQSDIAAKDEQIEMAKVAQDIAESEVRTITNDYEHRLQEQKKSLVKAHSEETGRLEERISALENDVFAKEETIARKNATIQKTDEDLLALGRKVDELEKEKKNLKDQYASAVNEAVALKEAELKEQYGLSTQEHVGTIKSLEENNEKKQGQINEYEGKIAQLKHIAQERELRLNELDKELKEARSELEQAKEKERQVSELQSKIDMYELELPGLRKAAEQIETLQAKIGKYETKISDLEAQKEKDAQEISDKQQRVQGLVEKVTQLENAAKKTNKELETLRTKGHEGENVVSKAKYDADLAEKDEALKLVKGQLAAAEGAMSSIEAEYEAKLEQQKQELETAAKQKLAEQEEQHKNAFEEYDQNAAAAKEELSEKLNTLKAQLEEAKKAVAVPEEMELVPKEELTNLRKGVRPDGKAIVDADLANDYIKQGEEITELKKTIDNQKGTINRMGQDISAKAEAIEAANKAREELQTAFEQYKQEKDNNVIKFKPENQETSKLFAALDELAKVYDFKLTSPDVGSSDEIRFEAAPTVENYLALLAYVRGKKTEDIAGQDTQPLPAVTEEPAASDTESDVAKYQEEVRASSADTQPISVVEEPAPEPEAPKTAPRLDETVEATSSSESADSTAKDPKYTSKPALVQTAADKEQAWYKAISAVITGKDVKTIKNQVFQGFLASDVENKRVEAYIFGNMAEDAYRAGDLEASLNLNKAAYEAGKVCIAKESDYSEFDKVQQVKREQNIALITKEISNKAA